MLHLEHKKGDPNHLDGRVTVYARIDIDPTDLLSMKHPIATAIHNGFLVVQGNFRDQNNLRDFLKSELTEGFSELVENIGGLDSPLDPQKLKDRLENLSDIDEFIPTPAKVVPFHSELEINSQEGDVFYAGSFQNIGNAVLGVNAVPIVYQARFREQEMQFVRNEIESLISQIEQTGLDENIVEDKSGQMPASTVEERILKEFIPGMLYSRKEHVAFTSATEQLRKFLQGYRFPGDIEAIIHLISSDETLHDREYKLLELYAKKIGAVCREDFSAADKYSLSIHAIDDSTDDRHKK